MPLGKYYCDYCHKEFQDTPSARRRHLQGIQHHRAKALWYDSFRDPQQALPQGFANRGVCNLFVRTGFSQYGDSCKYFHPKQNAPVASNNPGIMVAADQFQLPVTIGSQAVDSFSGNVGNDGFVITWGNLPPSLKPPPEGGYLPLPFVDWG